MSEPEYIDISELPTGNGVRGQGRWLNMLDEFKEIPTGKFIEITDRLNGSKPGVAAAAICNMLLKAGVRGEIIAVQRSARLFVMRPEEAQP